MVSGGTGYGVGDVVTMPGARGWRGEVSSVDSGAITGVRVIDEGDPYAGTIEFEVSNGTGAILTAVGTQGRPATFVWEATPFGPGTVTIASDAGVGAVVEPILVIWNEVSRQTGFNGVLSVGTIITDSDIWQASAYRVKTPADVELWGPLVKRMLHPIGKNMGVVKTVQSSITFPGGLGVVETE